MPETIAMTTVALRDPENPVSRELREMGYRLAVHPHILPPTREEQRVLLSDAVGLIAGSEPITREVLAEAPLLRVISRHGIGFDAIDLEAATERGIPVTFVPDAMTDAVADLTIGLMLSAARRIPAMDVAMKQGEWPRTMGADVTGRTLGLIGTGRIGMAVARRARAFRMRLLGSDPYPNPLFVEEVGGNYVPVEELLTDADYVSLHAPAMAGTRGMIGDAQLALMKPSAFLINCSRGSLIDEPALIRALAEGRLAGAGLDVLSEEPPTPGSHPDLLARLPNVVITPHIAAFTPITVSRMGRAAMENLLTVLRGERCPYIANPAVYGD